MNVTADQKIGKFENGAQLCPSAVTAKLISVFVFATGIVQFHFFLNPKFQAHNNLL